MEWHTVNGRYLKMHVIVGLKKKIFTAAFRLNLEGEWKIVGPRLGTYTQ